MIHSKLEIIIAYARDYLTEILVLQQISVKTLKFSSPSNSLQKKKKFKTLDEQHNFRQAQIVPKHLQTTK